MKEQQATFGISVPPHIEIEIEQIEGELKKLGVVSPVEPEAPLYIEASIFYNPDTKDYFTRFDTSAGKAVGTLALSTSSDTLQKLRSLRQYIGQSIETHDLPEEYNQPRKFGETLFGALFNGKALDLYRQCQRRLAMSTDHQKERHLFIKINLNAPDLAYLPWELLRDPGDDFLALDRHTPIIRSIPDCPRRPMSFEPEWRILLVGFASGQVMPDLRRDLREIQSAFKQTAPNVNLKIGTHLASNRQEFNKILWDFAPHILHLIGYGGSGQLLLDGTRRIREPINIESLSPILKNIPSLRLIFLNAWEKGVAEVEDNLDLAHALSRMGIPAVVVNQFPAREAAVRRVSHEFYRALANGLPVDEAILRGRVALAVQRESGGITFGWATPVLYLQSTDGHIFRDLLQRQKRKDIQAEIDFHSELTQARRKELTIHYSNLNHLREQKAKMGGEVSVNISNQITDEEEAIARLEEELEHLDKKLKVMISAASPAKSSAPYEKIEYDQESPPLQKLAAWYEEAQRVIESEQWGEAVILLQQIIDIDAHYEDALPLWKQATQQAHLNSLYKQGDLAYQDRQWAEAVEFFGNIEALESGHLDVAEKLAEAQQQLHWNTRYEQGLDYIKRGDWDQAVEVLGQVEPDDLQRRNLPRDLKYARARQTYAHLHERVKMWDDRAQDWAEIIKLLEPVVAESATYPEADTILQKAREQMGWLSLYEEGQRCFEAKDWPAAIKSFESLYRKNSDYRDTFQQLQRARRMPVLSLV